MKQARTRQRHSHRDRNASDVGHAPQRPPVTPPRSTERSAIPLPDVDEPLVECGPLSRQSRRQERRAQAKAARRRGAPVSVAALVPTETAVVAAVAPVADAIAGAFADAGFRPPEFLVAVPSDGAERIA